MTDRLRVAVLAGGASAEAEVSRSSAREVATALAATHDPVLIELDNSVTARLAETAPDVVFPVLHGPPGEDGTVQGFLEILELPYVGSDVRGAAVAMDKHVAKELFRRAGLPILDDLIFGPGDEAEAVARVQHAFGDRVVIKPLRQGSAIGVTPLANGGDLERPLAEAFRFGDGVLVEPYFLGREITVGVLDLDGDGPLALPVIEVIVGEDEWYDYENRYAAGKSEHRIPPAGFSDELLKELQRIAVEAHTCLGLRDLSRADFIVSDAGEVMLLEVNALPGMTPTSLFPDGARAIGIAFEELVDRLVRSAWRRHRMIG